MSLDLKSTVALSDEALEAIAARVAELLASQADAATPWMTLEEAADYLRWPKQRLYKLTAADAIPMRRHGNRILFHRHELDAWLEEHREGPHVDAGAPVVPFPSEPAA